MTVKIILKETRQGKGLSREQLAVDAGISISYLIRLEQNGASRVSFDIFDRLCKALNCEIQDVLKFVND